MSQREAVVRELQLAQVPKKTTCMHADDGVPTAALPELAENSCMGAMKGDLDLDQPGQTEGEWEY